MQLLAYGINYYNARWRGIAYTVPQGRWRFPEGSESGGRFGSRIADGVYETLLDGMELEELREHEGIDVKHYLMVDAYETWWQMGRSYLCRMIDMLHMGYVDEVLFGREVVDRLPILAKQWMLLDSGRS